MKGCVEEIPCKSTYLKGEIFWLGRYSGVHVCRVTQQTQVDRRHCSVSICVNVNTKLTKVCEKSGIEERHI